MGQLSTNLNNGLLDFLGYSIVALLALVLLLLGIILMILFTLVDGAARLYRKVFA